MKAEKLYAGLLIAVGMVSQPLSANLTLNVDQAIERALASDPRIDEKKAFVRRAQGLLQEAEGSGGLIYSLDSFLAVTNNVDGGLFEGGATTCAVNCTPRDDVFSFDDGISLWGGLTFSIIKPLTTFGRLASYKEAAEQNILVKAEDVEIQRANIRLDVVKAYYGFLAARDSRFLLEDALARLNSALELVEEWLDEDKGNVTQANRYALQSGVGLVKSYLSTARGMEAIAQEGLKLLTDTQSEEVEPEDKRLIPVELPERSLQQWIDTARANRPEFRQVAAGLSARRALLEAKRAEKRPVVFAGVAGTLAYAPGRDRLDNPHIFDPFNHAALSPLVGLRWSWEQGAQPARVAQAQSELDALVHTASFARKGIPFQVTEAYHTVQSKYQSMRAMESSARAARRWMIAAYTDFESGLGEAEKILTAMQVYVLAYAEYLQIVNDFNNQVFKLKSVSGVNQ